jgi:hypothetical protein
MKISKNSIPFIFVGVLAVATYLGLKLGTELKDQTNTSKLNVKTTNSETEASDQTQENLQIKSPVRIKIRRENPNSSGFQSTLSQIENVHPLQKMFPEAKLLKQYDSKVDNKGIFVRNQIFETQGKYALIRWQQQILKDGEKILNETGMVADHIIVNPTPGMTQEYLESIFATYGAEIRRASPSGHYLVAFQGMEPGKMEWILEKLKAEQGAILSAEPDFLVSL